MKYEVLKIFTGVSRGAHGHGSPTQNNDLVPRTISSYPYPYRNVEDRIEAPPTIHRNHTTTRHHAPKWRRVKHHHQRATTSIPCCPP
jgi:hypothetical protein